MQTCDLSDPKYACLECERRFVVRADDWRALVQLYSKTFEDTYLTGTRLRLRVQTDSETGRRVLKLNRKFESPSPYFRMVNGILLSPSEHEALNRLEGRSLTKVRYYHLWNERVFSVDVFEGELAGLVTCETESTATHEVTEDPFFTGDSLSRATRGELQRALSRLG